MIIDIEGVTSEAAQDSPGDELRAVESASSAGEPLSPIGESVGAKSPDGPRGELDRHFCSAMNFLLVCLVFFFSLFQLCSAH